jgi:hypothetical protein
MLYLRAQPQSDVSELERKILHVPPFPLPPEFLLAVRPPRRHHIEEGQYPSNVLGCICTRIGHCGSTQGIDRPGDNPTVRCPSCPINVPNRIGATPPDSHLRERKTEGAKNYLAWDVGDQRVDVFQGRLTERDRPLRRASHVLDWWGPKVPALGPPHR